MKQLDIVTDVKGSLVAKVVAVIAAISLVTSCFSISSLAFAEAQAEAGTEAAEVVDTTEVAKEAPSVVDEPQEEAPEQEAEVEEVQTSSNDTLKSENTTASEDTENGEVKEEASTDDAQNTSNGEKTLTTQSEESAEATAGVEATEEEQALTTQSEDDVASVTDENGEVTTFATLQDAIENAQSGDTVTLLADVKLETTKNGSTANYIAVQKKLVFDLNGQTASGGYLWVYGRNAQVTIKDSSDNQTGKIEGTSYGIRVSGDENASAKLESGSISGTYAIRNQAGTTSVLGGNVSGTYGVYLQAGTVNIEAGHIVGSKKGITTNSASGQKAINIVGGQIECTANPADSKFNETTAVDAMYGTQITVGGNAIITGGFSGIGVWDEGTKLVMNGGVVTGSGYGIAGNGSADGTEIELKGGSIKGDALGIYHPQQGKMTVPKNSTVVVSGSNGLQVCGGTVNIAGGTFISTDVEVREDPVKSNSNNDGSVGDGAAISVVSRSAYGQTTVEITGGTFTSQSGNKAFRIYGAEKVDGKWVFTEEHDYAEASISGGCFSSEIPAEACAEGYVPAAEPDENGQYTVKVSEEDAVVSIESNGKTEYYLTLQEALTAAHPGETLTLLKDTTITGQTNVEKGLTLDLNEKELKCESNSQYGILTQGSDPVTIKNGVISSNAKSYGIYVAGGTTSIENVVIVAKGNGLCVQGASVCTLDELCIIVASDNGIVLNGTTKSAADPTVNIYGSVEATNSAILGKSKCHDGNIVNIYDGAAIKGSVAISHPCAGKINISGGSVTARSDTCFSFGEEIAASITGGEFTHDVTAYCASGFGLAKVGNAWVAHEHQWNEGTITTEPTCTNFGEKTFKCQEEGCCSADKTEPVDPKEHTRVVDSAKAATCTEAGLTEGTHCSACGETLVAQTETPALGHNWGEWIGNDATCDEAGDKTRTCAVCQATESEHADAFGHSWGEWTVVTPAQPGVAGQEQRTCANDSSHVETREIAALPVDNSGNQDNTDRPSSDQGNTGNQGNSNGQQSGNNQNNATNGNQQNTTNNENSSGSQQNSGQQNNGGQQNAANTEAGDQQEQGRNPGGNANQQGTNPNEGTNDDADDQGEVTIADDENPLAAGVDDATDEGEEGFTFVPSESTIEDDVNPLASSEKQLPDGWMQWLVIPGILLAAIILFGLLRRRKSQEEEN